MIQIEVLRGADLTAALADLAALRIEVFRAFPYLYDGDDDYEQQYLSSYVDNDRACLVAAVDGNKVVGAATAMPLADHADAAQLVLADLPSVESIYYCAESVLLPQYRGQGIGHAFFDYREGQARALGFEHSLFCSVVRAADHPARPADYRPLDAFWRKRGYVPVHGVSVEFDWTDVGNADSTPHALQAWMRAI